MATITISGKNCTSYSGGTEIASAASVGTTWDGNFQMTLVCRYKFTTDAYGATRLSFKTSNATAVVQGHTTSEDSIGRMRFALGTSPTEYKTYKGNDKGQAITSFSYGNYVQGSINVNLKPNTTYYLWIFPAENFHGYTRFNLGTCTATTSGSYGTASSISASGGEFGKEIKITLANAVSGTINTVSITCGGITKTILNRSASMSASWTPSLSEYGAAIPNSKTAQATITCTTYYGSANWGSSNKSITVSFPNDAEPTIESVVVTYDNSGTGAASITTFVQNYSKARATIEASAKYGASITRYELSIDGKTESGADSTVTSGTITASGTIAGTIRVFDSRGFSTSTTVSVEVEAYMLPMLSCVDIHRSDIQGQVAEAGEYLCAYAIGRVADVAGQNSMQMSVAYRRANGGYGAETRMTSGQREIISGLSPDVTYIARITLIDALGNTATAAVTIRTRKWAMKFNRAATAVGFGKAPELDEVLEIPHNWKIKVGDLFAVVYPVGSIYMSVTNVDPGVIFGGTWERITGRFLLAATDGGDNGASQAAGNTGGEAEVELAITNLPAHTHGSKTLKGSFGIRKVAPNNNSVAAGSGIISVTSGGGNSYPLFASGSGSNQSGDLVSVNASHEHASVGEGNAHENMPPYLAVYMWKRTA